MSDYVMVPRAELERIAHSNRDDFDTLHPDACAELARAMLAAAPQLPAPTEEVERLAEIIFKSQFPHLDWQFDKEVIDQERFRNAAQEGIAFLAPHYRNEGKEEAVRAAEALGWSDCLVKIGAVTAAIRASKEPT